MGRGPADSALALFLDRLLQRHWLGLFPLGQCSRGAAPAAARPVPLEVLFALFTHPNNNFIPSIQSFIPSS